MKHGELLVRKRFGEVVSFRYRFGPVPRINSYRGGGYFRAWYKRPKSTQERRAFYVYPEYVRAKRHACNLPDMWDDYQRGDTGTRKSWKNKKIKYQWQKNNKGERR